MIYTEQQLVDKIRKMIADFEDEVVEFKEARTNYSFKDIGKYFSALGNEATTMNIYAEVNENVARASIENLAKNLDVF